MFSFSVQGLDKTETTNSKGITLYGGWLVQADVLLAMLAMLDTMFEMFKHA